MLKNASNEFDRRYKIDKVHNYIRITFQKKHINKTKLEEKLLKRKNFLLFAGLKRTYFQQND